MGVDFLIKELLIIFVGVLGFLLVLFIRHKKKHHEPLVCPLKADCGAVINSRYSKILGIEITNLGMLYYGGIITAYILLLVQPLWAIPEVIFILLGITTIAFLFSMYLVSVQAFVLKQWCTWCLLSAIACIAIFGVALWHVPLDVVALFVKYKTVIVLIHAFAAAVGVGVVTVTDVFFFRFLKDYRISREEAATLHVLSDVIWVALGILVLSGIALFVQNSEVLIQTPKFLIKMMLVFILVINGVLLNRIIHPRLVDISFGERTVRAPGELHYLRKLSFAFGAVSIVSWYSVFILGWFRVIPLSFGTLFFIYLGIIVLAVSSSQYVDYLVSKRQL